MNTYRVEDLAKRYLQYDMIQTHTELPDFPEFRTRLLFAFLQEQDPQDSELLSLVTSLIQMALDTHDLVTETNEHKEMGAMRSRQLKVLAGDYFSSRFYHLLSQSGQIDMIRQLSASICEVNRLKMNLYLRMKQLKLTAEEYFQQSVGIKSQLFLSFQRTMSGVYERVWPEVLGAFTCCEVLAQELLRLRHPDRIQGSWAFWHVFPSATKEERRQLQAAEPDPNKLISILAKYNVTAHLYELLQEQVELLWSKIAQVGTSKLTEELRELAQNVLHPVTAPKALKER